MAEYNKQLLQRCERDLDRIHYRKDRLISERPVSTVRNERYLLRGLIHENEGLPKDDLFQGGFSAEYFAEIVEKGKTWSVLDK